MNQVANISKFFFAVFAVSLASLSEHNNHIKDLDLPAL